MAVTSLLTTDQMTDDVIAHWKKEIKKINPDAPDISIDNLLEQYRENPVLTEKIIEKAVDTMENTLYPADSIQESVGQIIKKDTPEYEEIMNLMNKQEQEEHESNDARSNDPVLSAEQNDPAIVCTELVDSEGL